MSRAFVKEDSPQAEVNPSINQLDAALEDELFGHAPGGPKNFITPKGFEVLQAELENLLKRPSDEASQRRVEILRRRIKLAEVIDPEKQSGDRVYFGATVTVLDENENLRTYRIVGVDEVDLHAGKVSWVSPIGNALLEAQVGDAVTIPIPHGEEEIEIQKIEYKPIN